MKRGFLVLLCASLYAMPSEAQVSLKSAGIGVSYWRPSLDYWNKRSMLTDYNDGYGATLSGTVMPALMVDIALVAGLSLAGQASYWSQSVKTVLNIGGINRAETFRLSIIPVSVGLTYRFTGPVMTDPTGTTRLRSGEPTLVPYAGVSVARYFLHSEFVRQAVNNPGSVSESQTGNNYGMQVSAGIEKKLGNTLHLTLDARYHIGSYKQSVRVGSVIKRETVSLNGVEAGLSLHVMFK
jgi:hypothetical protein